jgi:hypothetical protein
MIKRNSMFIHCPIIWIKDDEGNDVIFPVLDDPEIKEEENIIPLPEENNNNLK